jgi:hypothetical protein
LNWTVLWRERLQGFFFPVETDAWVGFLRIGLGLQIISYVLSLKDDWIYLFAETGDVLIGRRFSEALLSIQSPLVPRLGWLVALGGGVGLPEWLVLSITWWTLLGAGGGLFIGLFSRSSAIIAWFIHLCAAQSGGLVSYGVDSFMTIGLFYLMLSPLPGRYSLDQKLRQVGAKDLQMLGFWRRVLQVHLCLIYFFGGITKALGGGWWNGSNLWRALVRPPFNLIAPEILVRWKSLFPFLGISVWVIEVGYIVFIWNRRTRPIWLVCVIGMHIAIGLAMGMYLFAFVMIVLNLAAFGPDWEFAKARETVRFLGLRARS